MTTAQIEAGTLTASLTDRIVSGLLLPYGEVGNTNLGKFSITRGAIRIPRDASVVGANLDHLRESPVGRATSLTDTDAGIVVSYKIADTEEGDALLAEIADGTRTSLSAEVSGIVLRAGKAVAGSLFGGSFVSKGAFPSASLMAADVGETPEDAPEDETPEALIERLEAELAAARAAIDTATEALAEADATTPEPEDKETPLMANATVPNTLSDSASEPSVDRSKTGLFELIKAARNMDPAAVAELQTAQNTSMFAALADVKYSGTGALGTGVVQPAWVGELWSGRSFERKIIPLLSTGVLTSMTEKGYRWVTKPEVSIYGGNKAEVPTNSPTTSAYSVDAVRFAGAWDIDRAFYDLGETEVLNSFFSHMVNSYAAKTDAYALTQVLAAATSSVSETYPTGVNVGMGRIVQGALNVITAGGTPTSAIVAPDVYKQLIFTREDDKLAFLSTAIGLEAGSLESFRVVPHAGLATGNVLVLDKNAATFKELGSGIRVNALDVARAGVDEAIYGYALVKVDLPAAIQRVTPAA